MPDQPTDPESTAPAPGGPPGRSLSEILAELAQLSHAHQGEASEMRGAVSELSRALARLFEMIRTDRHEQRERIAQLERELKVVRGQLADAGLTPLTAPAANDFDELRAAAERLRARTAELMRDAGDADDGEASLGADDRASPMRADGTTLDELLEPAPEAGPPVLRVIDGAVAPDRPAAPTELPDSPPAQPIAGDGEFGDRELDGDGDLDVECDLPLVPAAQATAPITAPDDALPSSAARLPPVTGAPARPPAPEPIAVSPRPARKRPLLRRRRIDARKLTGVEPVAALGSMVAAIDPVWTAGCPLDLVVAFTDGGALRVAGGDRVSLRVEEVEPGVAARCTVTATRRQLVPLFGRLELTDAESAPLIHGSRRDADLLVGWLDRAQRLAVEPL
ncbi:MAG: hypothetical protein QM679_06535 [Patulibacter sp.]